MNEEKWRKILCLSRVYATTLWIHFQQCISPEYNTPCRGQNIAIDIIKKKNFNYIKEN